MKLNKEGEDMMRSGSVRLNLELISFERVIQRLLEIERVVQPGRGERRIVYCLDQFGILQQVEETLLFDQIDDFRVIPQGDDLRIFGQLFRSGIGEETFRALRVWKRLPLLCPGVW